jgi:2-methylisocitrate lyase-like PEP mutase family enzyme
LLRKLIARQETIVALGAYDALTARIIEQAGFPAVS